MKLFTTAIIIIAMTTMSFAQISGTAHDFSGAAWNTQQYADEICIVCHTPHNAMALTTAPLWNHEVSAVAAYTLYTSTTMNSSTGQPSASSKLCLGCHDGTVALENYGAVTGSTVNYVASPFGTDLSNEHPISMDYTTAIATADGGLNDPSVALSGLGGTITADLLVADQMQCSSCHDVHNAYGQNSLLVKSNSGSALCLTCHDK